jgi:chromosome segregation ATPase
MIRNQNIVAIRALVLLVFSSAGISDAERTDDSPVDKVVTLLQDLAKDLEKDEKAEQAIYDKYACWCEETTARKAKAIEDAMEDMKALGRSILKSKGTAAVRTEEIAELKTKIKENEEAQAEATAIRGKENAAWQAESEETKDALAAINLAMGVLMKATKPALLQQDATTKLQSTLSSVLAAVPMKGLASVDAAKLEMLRSFTASLSQVNAKAKYAPQSMTIQGILSDMYTTMGVNLMTSTSDEASKQRAFEDFIAAKDKALTEMKTQLNKKQREKVEAENMLAEATQAYDDVAKQLPIDTEFFDVTKKACKEKTEQWSERSQLRKDELEGIDKALEILNSPEAKAKFDKSFNNPESFLQLASTVARRAPKSKRANLETMYEKLKDRASKSHSLRLAVLASQVRMAKVGHFDKVIEAIDKLIGVLAKEQEDDTKKRDQCEEQYQDIAQESAKLEWKIKNNKAKIEKLTNLIEKREEEKAQTIKEIEATEKEIKDMTDERKKENAAFIQAKKDDLEAIELLEKAKETLMEFYKKEEVDLGSVQGNVKFAVEPTKPVEVKATPPATSIDRLADVKVKDEEKTHVSKEDVKAYLKTLDHNGDGKLTKKEVSKGPVSLLQEEPDPLKDPDVAPEAKFSGKGNRKNQAKGIISLMTMLIEDVKAEISNEIKAEEEAQVTYEKALAAAEKLLEELKTKKVNLEEAIAKRKKEKVDEEADLKDNEADLEEQKKEKDAIKEDCDYMLEKYSERMKYREAETQALTEAKEFLANYYDSADEEEFLQAGPAHASFPRVSFSHLSSPHLRD